MARETAAFSKLQVILHWLIAVLIVAAWFTPEGMGRALKARIDTGQTGFEGATLHTTIGGLVFILLLVRIAVRAIRGAPGPVPGMPAVAERAAVWGHRVLYLLMFLTPAFGMIVWFGKFRSLGDVHDLLGNALMLVAVGHAGVALLHHYAIKDETLVRMLPWMKRPGV